MINKIIQFVLKNYWTIGKVVVALFLLYWIVFVLTPKSRMTSEQKQLLDSLNNKIDNLHKDNVKLENNIDFYNQKITEIDQNIDRVKNQKTIIKEYYHEKIIGVDKLSVAELDSFFTNRYGQ